MQKIAKHNHNLVLRSDIVEASRNSSKYVKEPINLFRNCPKFNDEKTRDRQLKENQAIIFLKLRSHKCKRHDAVVFSQRHLCKWDSTITKDGPASCRILNPKPIKQAMISGWQNAGDTVLYDVGMEHETDPGIFCPEDSQDKIIQREFERNEANIKNDFKSKIKNLQNFYEDLNKKYNFDINKLGYDGLKEQLQKFNQVYRDSREKPLKYMKHQGIRFFHILDQFPKEDITIHGSSALLPIKQKESVIEELDAFQQLINVKRNKLKIKEKFADDLFFHLGTANLVDVNGVQGNKFIKMEDQSKALISMATSTGVSLSMGSKKQKEPNMQHQNDLMASDKDQYATEFNQSQYVFKLKEVHSLTKVLRISKVKKIMESIYEEQPNTPKPDSEDDEKEEKFGESEKSKSTLYIQKPSKFNLTQKSMQQPGSLRFVSSNQSYHTHQTSQHNPNHTSLHRIGLKRSENEKILSFKRLSLSSPSASLSADTRETKFQIKMRGFIKRNIEKINQPYQIEDNISPSNLEQLIKARLLLTTRERSKIQQQTQPLEKYQKVKGKLSLDLMKGRNIFIDHQSQPAKTTRESKIGINFSPEQIRKLLRQKNNQHLRAAKRVSLYGPIKKVDKTE